MLLSRAPEPVESATFSPDGRRVVTASEDNMARIWEANGASYRHPDRAGLRRHSSIRCREPNRFGLGLQLRADVRRWPVDDPSAMRRRQHPMIRIGVHRRPARANRRRHCSRGVRQRSGRSATECASSIGERARTGPHGERRVSRGQTGLSSSSLAAFGPARVANADCCSLAASPLDRSICRPRSPLHERAWSHRGTCRGFRAG